MKGTPTSDDGAAPAAERSAADSCAAAAPSASGAAAASPVLRSEDLFAGGREVVIVHRGMRYRLLETRQGKLILNK